ncbi:hypothetical protein ACTFIW_007265 [Dictyostelium discoideum]
MDTTFHSALSIIDNGSMNDNDKTRIKDYLNRNSDKAPSIIDANSRFKNDPNHLNNFFQQMMLQDQSKPQFQQQQQPSSSSTTTTTAGGGEFDNQSEQYKDQSQQPSQFNNNDFQQKPQPPQFNNPQSYGDNSQQQQQQQQQKQEQPTNNKFQQTYGGDDTRQTPTNRNFDDDNNNYNDDANNYNQGGGGGSSSGGRGREDRSNPSQTPRSQQLQQQRQSQEQKYDDGYQQQRTNQQQYQRRPPDVRDDSHPNDNNDEVNIFKNENAVNPMMTFDPFIDWMVVKHNLNLHSGWLKRKGDRTGRRVRSPFPPGDYELIDAVPESKRVRVVFSSPINNYWDSDRRITINHSDNPDEIRRKIQSAFKFDRRHFSLYQLIEAGTHNKVHNLEYNELDENKTYELIIPWLSKLSRRKEDQIANKDEKGNVVSDSSNTSSNKINKGNVTNNRKSRDQCLIN